MSSLERSCRRARRQNIPKPNAPVSSETTSDPSSEPCTVHSAGAEKKTRGKAVRAVAEHPDTKASPVSHTLAPQTAATNGHLPQNTATRSLKNAPKGRRKKAEKTERSDVAPGESSDHFPDPSQTEQHKDKTMPSHTQRWKRTAKESSTHATLSCLSFQQDTPISPPQSDSGVKVSGRGRRPNPRLSSTPQRDRTPPSKPQVSPVTVLAHLSFITLPVIHKHLSINSSSCELIG